ncbi:Survival protein SurA precursor (Peptidyl-prolyl cis-trans isomerase SurA) [plant metagenome]
MRSALHLSRLALASAALALSAGAVAQPAPAASAPSPVVDGIAAVVDKSVITWSELQAATRQAERELAQQNIQRPDPVVLQRQVLQRLIRERLEDQEASRLGIRVTDEQVDQAIATIAQRNRITPQDMRKQIESQGTSWEDYRVVLRRDVMLDRVRQRTVDGAIVITDNEIDAFLKEQEARRGSAGSPRGAAPTAVGGAPTSLALAQILVRVPEGSTPDQVAALRKKADDLLARVRGGEDFAALAASSSDGPEALQGGAMGERAADGWPDLFLNATANVQPGQVSEVIQSGNGFHIVRVVSRSGGSSNASAAPAPGAPQGPTGPADGTPMPVTQTHARHILIKTSAVMSDEQARQRLEQVRQRIVQGGESFADLARRYSNDASAPQGGELGWLSPGQTVPDFERAMDALPPDGISEPIQSQFGWHLIQVIERRTQDMAEEYRRMQARQALFERRAGPAFEEFLDQLQDRAYIDNRLERRERLEQSL